MATKTKTATKTKGSTVEFYLSIPVTAKDIRTIIDDSLLDITEGFAAEDATARKRIEETKRALFTDGKFRSKIAEYFTKELRDCIRADLDYCGPRFDDFPMITKLAKELRAVEDAQLAKWEAEREAQKIKDAIKMLKSKGFRVTEGA